jgi:hypothetical protein
MKGLQTLCTEDWLFRGLADELFESAISSKLFMREHCLSSIWRIKCMSALSVDRYIIAGTIFYIAL